MIFGFSKKTFKKRKRNHLVMQPLIERGGEGKRARGKGGVCRTRNRSVMMLLMSALLGDLLIIIAQIISATQFVYEEKYIKKHGFHPLLVVGLEGLVYSVYSFTQ